jgi:hypothetical protein
VQRYKIKYNKLIGLIIPSIDSDLRKRNTKNIANRAIPAYTAHVSAGPPE